MQTGCTQERNARRQAHVLLQRHIGAHKVLYKRKEVGKRQVRPLRGLRQAVAAASGQPEAQSVQSMRRNSMQGVPCALKASKSILPYEASISLTQQSEVAVSAGS